MLQNIMRYCLENRLVAAILIILTIGWGAITAPFGWKLPGLPSDPVPVDAIPNLGENQQIVFTPWEGHSPQDIEDQITYPLTTSLLGIPGVKSVRSSSIFGFSSIYIIFQDDIDFYWSRSRILEKINALPPTLLPAGATPALGPDATALGQVFWYTLEGRDEAGNPTGGWDLHEIRSVQDFYVKYALNAVEGVSEVASIGGFVQEYQVDVDPDALRVYDISLQQVMTAVGKANRDVGAKTIEINQAEYLVRGLGYVKSIEDLENAVVAVHDQVPIHVKEIGMVTLGPATRRGALDKAGAEVAGGVVLARYGANPLQVIEQVKAKIDAIAPGLPRKTLANGVESRLTIVPFYDRTQLVQETLGTLEEALSLEVLVTILVVVLITLNLRASIVIAGALPIAILMVFIAMRYGGIDANIVALSGIAIAIGTMVDLGIVMTESVLRHLNKKDQLLATGIRAAAKEVTPAIVTSVATTIVSFLPVFTLTAAEGALFRPLAYTKTLSLIAALVVVLFMVPAMAHWVFGFKVHPRVSARVRNGAWLAIGLVTLLWVNTWAGVTLVALGIAGFVMGRLPAYSFFAKHLKALVAIASVLWLLTDYWMPLGIRSGFPANLGFVVVVPGTILLVFYLLLKYYPRILQACLKRKSQFMWLPGTMVFLGLVIWLGFNNLFGFVATGLEKAGLNLRETRMWSAVHHTFPGIGREFMPSLDEGSFLLMPTAMPHAGMERNLEIVQQMDMMLAAIPEVDMAVGKMGRAESALDPAPISMYEVLINYKPEYHLDAHGTPGRFRVDDEGKFVLASGDHVTNNDALKAGMATQDLIADDDGAYFRNWREHIRNPGDIWNEIVRVTQIPGVTSAPKLQPIETRLVMLQTGMRAPMGVKVFGPDLPTIEDFAFRLEKVLKTVPGVRPETVFADRVVGKPYIHCNIDRVAIARYGLTVEDVQQTIEAAIGGKEVTTTVEGRNRYAVRVRYPRELRDHPDKLLQVRITTPNGDHIPLDGLVTITYARGPQMIRSEDTFLLGYVLFDKYDGMAAGEVVEAAQQSIAQQIEAGTLVVPKGVSFRFAGNYESQIRAEARLALIIPITLAIILLILYFRFRSVTTAMMVFAGVAMAFSGGFLMLWLYGQDWFFNINVMGIDLQALFQIEPVNLSVAVWVGFIALFGIATDDGVLMATCLDQYFAQHKPTSLADIHRGVLTAGKQRIKPAIMTSATTIIALLPILTATGRGSDIMIPMAIPVFGGMVVASITYFIVPVLYCWRAERKLNQHKNEVN